MGSTKASNWSWSLCSDNKNWATAVLLLLATSYFFPGERRAAEYQLQRQSVATQRGNNADSVLGTAWSQQTQNTTVAIVTNKKQRLVGNKHQWLPSNTGLLFCVAMGEMRYAYRGTDVMLESLMSPYRHITTIVDNFVHQLYWPYIIGQRV